MDLRHFLELYTAEAQEHVRLLQRNLLQLESGAGGAAIEEAFRAAHTLKGMSAAMGFADVSDLAHSLEDRLADVRSGASGTAPPLVDELLAAADAIGAAVDRAIAGDAADPAPAVSAAPASTQPAVTPAGTATIAGVRLCSDAALPAVRALLVLRSLDGTASVLGTDPACFDDEFDGHFRIFLGAGAADATVRTAILSVGDVEHVTLHAVGSTAQPAPVTSAQPVRIRMDANRIDEIAEAVAELSVLFARLRARASHDGVGAQSELSDRMGVLIAGLQHGVLQLRMAPVGLAFERLPRVVRDAARRVGREVELTVSGDDVELDRAIVDAIGEPLVHLLRNAVDHGIEPAAERAAAGKDPRGHIRLHAERERSSVSITISDDGRGVDAARVLAKARAAGLAPGGASPNEELFRIMCQAGMTTADAVSAVSGRGVGLDVVASRIRALGGAISMRTLRGQGTSFAMRLPITLALAQALRVRVGGEDYVIPLTHVAEVIGLDGGAADEVVVRGERVPLIRLRRTLQAERAGTEEAAIVAGMGERRVALAVDELVGREQILVKPFEMVKGVLPYFSGATLLADGRPALVLDPLSVI